ncbi:TFIIB zinc-binding protein, partial [Gregarina niphandrodes]
MSELRCGHCRSTRVQRDAAGFYVCAACGTVVENVRATERDEEDVLFEYTGDKSGETGWSRLVAARKRRRVRAGPAPAPDVYFRNDFADTRVRRELTEADLLWALGLSIRRAVADLVERYQVDDGAAWESSARFVWLSLLKFYRQNGIAFRSHFADSAHRHLNLLPTRLPGLLQDQLAPLDDQGLAFPDLGPQSGQRSHLEDHDHLGSDHDHLGSELPGWLRIYVTLTKIMSTSMVDYASKLLCETETASSELRLLENARVSEAGRELEAEPEPVGREPEAEPEAVGREPEAEPEAVGGGEDDVVYRHLREVKEGASPWSRKSRWSPRK